MIAWTTLIYDPIAYWTWNPSGWMFQMGALDFAGGTPVHISAGCAALAYSIILGKRLGHDNHGINHPPHNVTHIVTGTIFLWVGWFGFNAGSANAANMRAVMAAVVTNLSACVGGVTWCLLDYRFESRWSAVGFCSGVVAGLVAITPGSGYVPAWSAIVFGAVGAAGMYLFASYEISMLHEFPSAHEFYLGANYATKLKFILDIDDALDIFAEHAIGGLIGNVLTGFFATDYITHLDGISVVPGGWLNHNWVQLGYQLADSLAGGIYSFFGTCIILSLMNLIPGLSLRVSEQVEISGLDDDEIGESTYDYYELSHEILKALTLNGLNMQSNIHGQQLNTHEQPDDEEEKDLSRTTNSENNV